MASLNLDERDRTLLAGERGEAARLAMRVLVRMAEMSGAARLIDIEGAHIDGCLYHGRAGLDFVERLVAGGGRVAVPTTLNVGSLDLMHPERYRGDPSTAASARALMDRYVDLGCTPTWTCAPYQQPEARPPLGTHVAWAESNAIVFANSVLGARTDRYGDLLDISAAITGRVPEAGLHLAENRRGEVLVRLEVPDRVRTSGILYPLLGIVVGTVAGGAVPVIVGIEDATEDDLKALGAAAASSGSVGMFHAVGRTPEAPTLDAALGGRPALREVVVTTADLRRARDGLESAAGPLVAVSLGTPHASPAEIAAVQDALDGHRLTGAVPLYLSTSRAALAAAAEAAAELEAAGVTLVTDTCTYVTPILARTDGTVMTSSAKWAYYAPGNLGVGVAFGSVAECVASALSGSVVRDEEVWA